MFGRSMKMFKLLGFEVKIDLSWIVIAVLVTWSLAKGAFPAWYPNLTPMTYWTMGVVGALGLFVSIVAHEFCHSLVARQYGMSMKGITLFIFGGVAEMGDEPPTAKAEFMMAIAGPLSSLAIGGIFYLVYRGGEAGGWNTPVNAVTYYLFYINFILAAFNLLPAFPLDGGRVLRSILWGAKDNLRWATRVSSSIGSAFGLGLIFLGVSAVHRRQRYRRGVDVLDRHVFKERRPDVVPAAVGAQGPGGRTGAPLHERPPGDGAGFHHRGPTGGRLYLQVSL